MGEMKGALAGRKVTEVECEVDLTGTAEAHLLVWEGVTVVASKISVAQEILHIGLIQVVSRTTLTTTPSLSRDWGTT
ncbi:uncharacterized protein LOC121312049 isoform X2 [Polyodon spathula]|uniref:uncharacterized protein LOC121312049 isoform X2 n=1 Tax=Polyodon spathula TaxID=7913 RepID=UPI001B7E9605|nr:uncharacterized protein LOC121312049 isoform X2 [Polyodon spathula]